MTAALVIAGAGALLIALIMMGRLLGTAGSDSLATTGASQFTFRATASHNRTAQERKDVVTAAVATPEAPAQSGPVHVETAEPDTRPPQPTAEAEAVPGGTMEPIVQGIGPDLELARAAVVLADPPWSAQRPPTTSPPPSTAPAPDLLAAFLEQAEADPTGLRSDTFALGPDRAVPRAVLREHSVAVPLAAAFAVGIAVYALRRSRR